MRTGTCIFQPKPGPGPGRSAASDPGRGPPDRVRVTVQKKKKKIDTGRRGPSRLHKLARSHLTTGVPKP
eukprot:753219-Hanusia_phi.AAC.1